MERLIYVVLLFTLLSGCVHQPECPPQEVVVVREVVPEFIHPKLKIGDIPDTASTDMVIKALVSDIMTLKSAVMERDNVLDSFRVPDASVTR